MNTLHHKPYVQEILSQADSVKSAVAKFEAAPLKPLMQSMQRGGFDRIVLTGMGGSLFASYPIWLQLVNAGSNAYWIDCAELIHHARPILTRRSLVWITSQSGRSAEVVAALEIVKKGAQRSWDSQRFKQLWCKLRNILFPCMLKLKRPSQHAPMSTRWR
jgi:fructoselysine-6-P-deglycase FrlB-like protein